MTDPFAVFLAIDRVTNHRLKTDSWTSASLRQKGAVTSIATIIGIRKECSNTDVPLTTRGPVALSQRGSASLAYPPR